MMNIKKYISILAIIAIAFGACKKDDDVPEVIQPRDLGEQSASDDQKLQDYLKTHFYNSEDFIDPFGIFDGFIRFDTINEKNKDKKPLIDQVEEKIVTVGNVSHKLYILKHRKGVGEITSTLADSVLVSYLGTAIYANKDKNLNGIPDTIDTAFVTKKKDADGKEIDNDMDGDGIIDEADADADADGILDDGKLDGDANGVNDRLQPGTIFDSTTTPVWFDLLGDNLIPGFINGLVGSNGGEKRALDQDGTINFEDDFTIGAVFIPSGLAYFGGSGDGGNIAAYSSLIFSFKVFDVKISDHDGDGISSRVEILDANGAISSKNTDGDNQFDFLDADDDNDGSLTKYEVRSDTNGDGVINLEDDVDNPLKDRDNDGVPDYLDKDSKLE